MEKGSSPSSSSSSSSANGFNFGNKIYFQGGGGGAPPSPAVKGRSPPRCQVEGCRVDLSDAKAYYSRHKVCGMHSKYPKVIVAGLEQRFCQQCSRFHLLPEFDQGKRSCRRRLAGHNERRRKPSPGSVLSRNLCPSMIGHNSNAEGFVIDFGSAYPTFTGSPSSSERGFGNQLPWQRYNNSQDSLSTPRPADYFNGVVDSTNALSLLSNQPWAPKTRASGLGVSSLLGTNGAAMAQPSVNPGAATIGSFGCSSWCLKDDQGDSSLHEMPPDHGLGQSSHPNNSHYISLSPPQPNEGQFHELDHPRAYDSPVQHMHWLL